MSKSVKALLIAMIAVLSLVTVGCGALSKEEYEAEVEKVMKNVEKQGNKLFSSEEPTGDDMREASKLLNDAADDLEDISPPDNVAKLHERLVKAVRAMGGAMGDLAEPVDEMKKNPDRAAELLEDAQKTQDDLMKAASELEDLQKEFKKKGYKKLSENSTD